MGTNHYSGPESGLTDGIWDGQIRGFQPHMSLGGYPARFAVIGTQIHWMHVASLTDYVSELNLSGVGEKVNVRRISYDTFPERILAHFNVLSQLFSQHLKSNVRT